MTRILVAARDGLHTFDGNGREGPIQHEGRSVTTVAPAGAELWAVLDGFEIWHAPGEDAWRHIGDLRDLRAICLTATSWGVLVGSSEARLFLVGDEDLGSLAAFDLVEGRSTWHTPWGGPPDTRSMSEWDDDVYVNVHVGGIVRTSDRGKTWTPTSDIDADVHQVATADGWVLAACARGLAVSPDRGATWTSRDDGLEASYSRAVTVCDDAVLVSGSNGPGGGRSAVYRGDLAGGRFERCRDGLPGWFGDNIDTYRLDAVPEGSLVAFGTSDGRVYLSTDAGSSWSELASGLPPIQRVLLLP